jgi:type II restriction enzyme
MEITISSISGESYKNSSQRARVVTEGWVLSEAYCPNCGGAISNYINNKPVADFYCEKCVEDFELKSKNGKIGKKVSSGAYNQMIKRISSLEKPNFFFMGHVDLLKVNDFFVIPKHFFVTEIVEKRKPLAKTARRAGWVGSNILFSKIPKAGQIFYVEDGKEIPKSEVLEKWQKTVFLKKIKKADAKGWILDIMNCIDGLNKKKFTLADVYTFENDLKAIHPENKNIRPKIRQQLQLLRDKGYLDFVGDGTYRLR